MFGISHLERLAQLRATVSAAGTKAPARRRATKKHAWGVWHRRHSHSRSIHKTTLNLHGRYFLLFFWWAARVAQTQREQRIGPPISRSQPTQRRSVARRFRASPCATLRVALLEGAAAARLNRKAVRQAERR